MAPDLDRLLSGVVDSSFFCHLWFIIVIDLAKKTALKFFLLFADVDECTNSELNECDPNAMCTNTEGSYVCRCKKDFEGDGRNCTGKPVL